ncbi:MAG: DUF1015 domain-containing protein [Planctomycetes bacterium]|nr:DUF1015 domain-containing protein [Planctomycetota bacterium]
MAEVHPFRAWRYDLSQVGSLSDVTAPPYDVIDAREQKTLYERHPCNVVRLILNREEPGDAGPEARYTRAAEFLRHWKSEGILFREREDALYVYHQEFDWDGRHYVRKGFLGRLRLEEFGTRGGDPPIPPLTKGGRGGGGGVFPHEQTMSGPKADRLALTRACRMNLSPVFGLYPDEKTGVQTPLEEAIRGVTPLEATDDLKVVHRMWPVTDAAAINRVRGLAADKPIFIADGHHRYETAINYRNELRAAGKLGGEQDPANFVLMHFVGMSDPGLAILPTHRLVSGMDGLTADAVREALAAHFELETIGSGSDAALGTWEAMQIEGRQGVFGFGTVADGTWQLARLTDASPMSELARDQSEAWRALGVSLLHRLVLDHLLSRRSSGEMQFRYVHRLEEVTEAMAGRSCDLACLVSPAGIEHVREIASGYEKMPPKSTYFYPKLLSGLVLNPLAAQ